MDWLRTFLDHIDEVAERLDRSRRRGFLLGGSIFVVVGMGMGSTSFWSIPALEQYLLYLLPLGVIVIFLGCILLLVGVITRNPAYDEGEVWRSGEQAWNSFFHQAFQPYKSAANSRPKDALEIDMAGHSLWAHFRPSECGIPNDHLDNADEHTKELRFMEQCGRRV